MSKLLIEKYKGYNLYFFDEKYKQLGKDVIDNKINITKELKITERNYVVKIKYKDTSYILKSPRNEHRKIQRKIMTLFKRGESVSTLINTKKLEKDGFNKFARIYIAIVKRNFGIISDSYFVTEFIQDKFNEEDKLIRLKKNIREVLNILRDLHERKIYHGDLNPTNVINGETELKLIDSQCKTYYFGGYRINYDLLTLEYSVYETLGEQSWYNKNLWYRVAYARKFIRNRKSIKRNRLKNLNKNN